MHQIKRVLHANLQKLSVEVSQNSTLCAKRTEALWGLSRDMLSASAMPRKSVEELSCTRPPFSEPCTGRQKIAQDVIGCGKRSSLMLSEAKHLQYVAGRFANRPYARWRRPRLMNRSLVCVALVFGFVLPGLTFAGSPQGVDLQTVIQQIRAEAYPEEAMDYMRRLYVTDRWSTFPKYAETAEYLKSAMTRMGLQQVEVLAAPADGTSQFGYWTEPLAWDAKEARLEIVDPALPFAERTLADFQKIPCSLCMWSGSTPPEGVTAEVVDLKETSPESIARLDLHGKLVLTPENAANLKWPLVKAGALGAINTFTENPSLLDGRQWINAWGDNGWAFTRISTPLLCFSITPRETALVRKLLAEKGKVVVKATVDSRYYSGPYPYATAVIPGAGPEEVLSLGHSSEQGAEDNCTGVAAILEAATTLNRLIASGKLPRPRRAIRILNMGEMYGSVHYISTHPDRIRNTIAAFCLDTPAASYDLPGTEYTFYMNPQVASSYVDAFILKVAEDYFPSVDVGTGYDYIRKTGRPWHSSPFGTGTDSYLGDPTIGVPNVWAYSGSGVITHHNSEDTPDRVDSRSLRDLTIVNAAFLYYLASAGPGEAKWLAGLSEDRAYDMILRSVASYLDRIAAAGSARQLGGLLGEAKEKTDYLVGRGIQAVNSVERLAPETDREALEKSIAPLAARLRQFGDGQSLRIESAVRGRAGLLGITSAIEPMHTSDPNEPVAASIVVKRLRFGTIPLDDLAPDQREGYPSGAWDVPVITALYWCDGRRTLAEVMRLTRLEIGPTTVDYVGYFRFLRKHGYVEFVKGN